VQGTLEAAWEQFTQEQRRFAFSGRTDSGVHAQGQVVNVYTEAKHSPHVIHRALNALVPPDMAIHAAWEVDELFHARHQAVWRWYRYLIDDQSVPLPMLRNYVLHVGEPLDINAMQTALAALPGYHDFAGFTKQSERTKPTQRFCYGAACSLQTLFGRSLIAIDLVANAFLRHMVRMIVGAVILVGRGQLATTALSDALAGKGETTSPVGTTAAPHGLTLMAVGYREVLLPHFVQNKQWPSGIERGKHPTTLSSSSW
jgi:tRNA pseudouridine38-40 synthase